MHPAVVTTVLLLVGILNTSTADLSTDGLNWTCENIYKGQECGDGWMRIDAGRCIKYFPEEKTFAEAKEHCEGLASKLVSIHGLVQMAEALCTSLRASSDRQDFWIGTIRSGDDFVNIDGSDFDFSVWYEYQPDNFQGAENCVEVNHKDWGWWNDDNCDDKNSFMCAKVM